ncbi:MAG TPA: protein-L-isoaspartate(D-aspartate) O-methyltransferase [Dongiaceae bacterium]|jgi:protein-L-isoaspartate(D-aspartate) O-methyltransferase|nr:protein-L-isoaspartate(D-aspartate) O-methyltransferase [Dongiaceae bacterium]
MNLAQRKARLILSLRKAGINDHEVLKAIERIPRELFLPPQFHDQAYEDQALPIGSGQTISQPRIVAQMTQALELQRTHKVLEIGTGSGYQAAVLARLCRRVYSIERHKPLLEEAQARFAALHLSNITVLWSDGSKGWPAQAPFDRIIVTAASEGRPPALLDQLAENGIAVMPLGAEHGHQKLVRIERGAGGWRETVLADVRFVPLISGQIVNHDR